MSTAFTTYHPLINLCRPGQRVAVIALITLSVAMFSPHTSLAQSSAIDGANASSPNPGKADGDKGKKKDCPIPPAGTTTTTLLFPFVTNQAGFDTGIVISNTSLDTVGTTPQSGTCRLNYFGTTAGGGAAPAAQTSQTVPAGGQLTFTVSAGGNLGVTATPGFQGYIIATCNFQYAHGFAFVSDLGTLRFATSYLALVVPEGGRNPSGEQLAH
jgi:hypothetical protein